MVLSAVAKVFESNILEYMASIQHKLIINEYGVNGKPIRD